MMSNTLNSASLTQQRKPNRGMNKAEAISPESQELNHCLVSVANNRDKRAFATLFNHFAPKVRRIAQQKLNNESSALDVTQEVMSRVWKKAHLYSSEKGAATTWIYTIMRNVIFDIMRKNKNQMVESLSDDIWPIEEQLVDPHEVADHILSRRLDHLVDSLPDKQREALRAVYFEQMTHEQLGKQLDIPVGTVKSRIRLAVAKLKQQLGADHD